LIKNSRNQWNDPINYPVFQPVDPYAQYSHTNFNNSDKILVNVSKGLYESSRAQTVISEFDVSEVEFNKSGYKIGDYFLQQGNRCSKTGYQQKCKIDGALNFKPHYCNDKIHCPICARGRARSNGRRMFHTLTAGKDHDVAQLVLTLPSWHPLAYNTREARRDVYEYLYRKAKEFMTAHFRGYPHVAVVHSWSSKNPLQQPHWHVHILVNLMKVCESKVIYGSGYRHPNNLDSMRHTWAVMLGIKKGESNLYWNYCSSRNQGKVRHWCNYIARSAVLDVNDYLLRHDNPETLTDDKQCWYDFHVEPVNKRFRRIRWYGDLSDCKKSKYLEAIGSHLELVNKAIKDDIEESKRLFCWCCKAELDPSAWEWHNGLIPRKYFAKSNDSWGMFRGVVS